MYMLDYILALFCLINYMTTVSPTPHHLDFCSFFFFFKLYIIVLVLPNIKMNPPQVYMCSPSKSSKNEGQFFTWSTGCHTLSQKEQTKAFLS